VFAIRSVCAAAAAVTLIGAFGPGVAAADDLLVGQPYSQASKQISEWGASAEIETVVGARLPTDDCIVTNWHKSSFLGAGGAKRDAVILVSLNCNGGLASSASPGNSLASPEGQQEKKIQGQADFINTHPEFCVQDPVGCHWFCTTYSGRCTSYKG
jgi:hypothetical protein